MSSILTNTSAMGALSTLRGINDQLGDTQNRISTGLKVTSAKDNASYYSISTTMNSESGMNKAVNEGLTLEQSSFNGENLISTAGAGAKEVVSGVSRVGGTLSTTTIDFTTTDLQAVQGTFAAITIDDNTTKIDLEIALRNSETYLTTVTGAATDLGIAERAIETQQKFLSELTDKLDSGVGSMIDADMEEEAARLQSLQVQQQLATQSLSIANQSPQNILSLFQ